jgi:hypothetical protein
MAWICAGQDSLGNMMHDLGQKRKHGSTRFKKKETHVNEVVERRGDLSDGSKKCGGTDYRASFKNENKAIGILNLSNVYILPNR